ncbi:PREDICTED: rubisco accumulation factor 1.1, chloroplastic [Tarenaya hassleriana]|uniref:rubisco accumulation factor 1.1, chloroplastic n=1 Tax=Tarenaya hassleriana TaxID=28532 RepID=UPI00053C7F22|nr:PREDICTED: rubisco accumulation factor 1.1, chloroplastic [Tarenaya hassleriana]
MLSLTANTLKSSIFTPLTPSKSHGSFSNPITRSVNPRPITVTSVLIPSSDKLSPVKPNLYQPFRPPPSPVPSQFRTLDAAGKIEVLAGRMGLWFEYAPLISSLYTEGFTPPTIEELTGISGVEQNRLIVGAQVRDSMVETKADPDVIAAFDTGGAELLYEIRLLNATQRVAAAKYIVGLGFDAKKAQDLARAIKDYPRRRGDKGLQSFDYNLPGDCLSFMYYRQSREYRNPSEQRTAMLEQALEVAESDKAKNEVVRELQGGKGGGGGSKEDETEPNWVRVPVVRLRFGELAEATSVAVLPVCKAEEGREKVVEAPMESKPGGQFGIVEAEKEWSRWMVLPGWELVTAITKGGVAVAFRDDRKVLPWRAKEEALVAVVDRERKTVEAEDGFYLVAVGGDGEGLKVERGSALKARGAEEESLGLVVLIVRPPREEDQLRDEDWD